VFDRHGSVILPISFRHSDIPHIPMGQGGNVDHAGSNYRPVFFVIPGSFRDPAFILSAKQWIPA
ncbi:hypothetical protein, partial [Shewanella sp.]|uniref:hypothetical protein n=1 Tax=Shewanella sp. TaxID=50422 RepID=UPI00258A587D